MFQLLLVRSPTVPFKAQRGVRRLLPPAVLQSDQHARERHLTAARCGDQRHPKREPRVADHHWMIPNPPPHRPDAPTTTSRPVTVTNFGNGDRVSDLSSHVQHSS